MSKKTTVGRGGVLTALALMALACALGACNTVQGIGQDITYAGEATEEMILGESSSDMDR